MHPPPSKQAHSRSLARRTLAFSFVQVCNPGHHPRLRLEVVSNSRIRAMRLRLCPCHESMRLTKLTLSVQCWGQACRLRTGRPPALVARAGMPTLSGCLTPWVTGSVSVYLAYRVVGWTNDDDWHYLTKLSNYHYPLYDSGQTTQLANCS